MEPKFEFVEDIPPLFELYGQDGHIWKIYENGQIEGFPESTVLINRAWPLLTALRSRIINFSREQEGCNIK